MEVKYFNSDFNKESSQKADCIMDHVQIFVNKEEEFPSFTCVECDLSNICQLCFESCHANCHKSFDSKQVACFKQNFCLCSLNKHNVKDLKRQSINPNSDLYSNKSNCQYFQLFLEFLPITVYKSKEEEKYFCHYCVHFYNLHEIVNKIYCIDVPEIDSISCSYIHNKEEKIPYYTIEDILLSNPFKFLDDVNIEEFCIRYLGNTTLLDLDKSPHKRFLIIMNNIFVSGDLTELISADSGTQILNSLEFFRVLLKYVVNMNFNYHYLPKVVNKKKISLIMSNLNKKDVDISMFEDMTIKDYLCNFRIVNELYTYDLNINIKFSAIIVHLLQSRISSYFIIRHETFEIAPLLKISLEYFEFIVKMNFDDFIGDSYMTNFCDMVVRSFDLRNGYIAFNREYLVCTYFKTLLLLLCVRNLNESRLTIILDLFEKIFSRLKSQNIDPDLGLVVLSQIYLSYSQYIIFDKAVNQNNFFNRGIFNNSFGNNNIHSKNTVNFNYPPGSVESKQINIQMTKVSNNLKTIQTKDTVFSGISQSDDNINYKLISCLQENKFINSIAQILLKYNAEEYFNKTHKKKSTLIDKDIEDSKRKTLHHKNKDISKTAIRILLSTFQSKKKNVILRDLDFLLRDELKFDVSLYFNILKPHKKRDKDTLWKGIEEVRSSYLFNDYINEKERYNTLSSDLLLKLNKSRHNISNKNKTSYSNKTINAYNHYLLEEEYLENILRQVDTVKIFFENSEDSYIFKFVEKHLIRYINLFENIAHYKCNDKYVGTKLKILLSLLKLFELVAHNSPLFAKLFIQIKDLFTKLLLSSNNEEVLSLAFKVVSTFCENECFGKDYNKKLIIDLSQLFFILNNDKTDIFSTWNENAIQIYRKLGYNFEKDSLFGYEESIKKFIISKIPYLSSLNPYEFDRNNISKLISFVTLLIYLNAQCLLSIKPYITINHINNNNFDLIKFLSIILSSLVKTQNNFKQKIISLYSLLNLVYPFYLNMDVVTEKKKDKDKATEDKDFDSRKKQLSYKQSYLKMSKQNKKTQNSYLLSSALKKKRAQSSKYKNLLSVYKSNNPNKDKNRIVNIIENIIKEDDEENKSDNSNNGNHSDRSKNDIKEEAVIVMNISRRENIENIENQEAQEIIENKNFLKFKTVGDVTGDNNNNKVTFLPNTINSTTPSNYEIKNKENVVTKDKSTLNFNIQSIDNSFNFDSIINVTEDLIINSMLEFGNRIVKIKFSDLIEEYREFILKNIYRFIHFFLFQLHNSSCGDDKLYITCRLTHLNLFYLHDILNKIDINSIQDIQAFNNILTNKYDLPKNDSSELSLRSDFNKKKTKKKQSRSSMFNNDKDESNLLKNNPDYKEVINFIEVMKEKVDDNLRQLKDMNILNCSFKSLFDILNYYFSLFLDDRSSKNITKKMYVSMPTKTQYNKDNERKGKNDNNYDMYYEDNTIKNLQNFFNIENEIRQKASNNFLSGISKYSYNNIFYIYLELSIHLNTSLLIKKKKTHRNRRNENDSDEEEQNKSSSMMKNTIDNSEAKIRQSNCFNEGMSVVNPSSINFNNNNNPYVVSSSLRNSINPDNMDNNNNFYESQKSNRSLITNKKLSIHSMSQYENSNLSSNQNTNNLVLRSQDLVNGVIDFGSLESLLVLAQTENYYKFLQSKMISNSVFFAPKLIYLLEKEIPHLMQLFLIGFKSYRFYQNVLPKLTNALEFVRLHCEGCNRYFQTVLTYFKVITCDNSNTNFTFIDLVMRFYSQVLQIAKQYVTKKRTFQINKIFYKNLSQIVECSHTLVNFLIEISQGNFDINFKNIYCKDKFLPITIEICSIISLILSGYEEKSKDDFEDNVCLMNLIKDYLVLISVILEEYQFNDYSFNLLDLFNFREICHINYYSYLKLLKSMKLISSYNDATSSYSNYDSLKKLENFNFNEDLFDIKNKSLLYSKLEFNIGCISFQVIKAISKLNREDKSWNYYLNIPNLQGIFNTQETRYIKYCPSFFDKIVKNVEVIIFKNNFFNNQDFSEYADYYHKENLHPDYEKIMEEVKRPCKDYKKTIYIFYTIPQDCFYFSSSKFSSNWVRDNIGEDNSENLKKLFNFFKLKFPKEIRIKKVLFERGEIDKYNNYINNIKNEQISFVFSILSNIILITSMKKNDNITIATSSHSLYSNSSSLNVFFIYLSLIGQLAWCMYCFYIYAYINFFIKGKEFSKIPYLKLTKKLLFNNKTKMLALNFLICLLAILGFPYLIPFQLFTSFRFSNTLKILIFSIKLKFKDFLYALLLIVFIVLFYSSLAVYYFSDEVVSETGEAVCSNIFNCFFYLISYGFRSGSGFNFSVKSFDNKDYFKEFIAEWSFYFLLILIMANIINAIIVDLFQKISDQENVRIEKLTKTCIICNTSVEDFKMKQINLKDHILNSHFIYNYIYYFYYLKTIKDIDLSRANNQVKKMIESDNITFFPKKIE